MSVKWNQNLRRILYQNLKNEFGPIDQWFSTTNPTGSKEQFEEILNKISRILNDSSKNLNERFDSQKIKAQMAWGLQNKQSTCLNKGYTVNFILNRSMALEVGLITSKNLPKKCTFEY